MFMENLLWSVMPILYHNRWKKARERFLTGIEAGLKKAVVLHEDETENPPYGD
jgi:hypothetical protein